MSSLNARLPVFILSALLVSACSSSPKNTELDQKVSMQPPVTSTEQIAEKAAYTFSNMPGLSETQRQELMKIYSRTYMEAVLIKSEIGQSKATLFDLISTKSYKSSEVKHLKNKIKALDEKRLKIMFEALDEVQKIVGYGEDKVPFFKHFQDNEYPDSGRAFR